jgi:hypothetical protein
MVTNTKTGIHISLQLGGLRVLFDQSASIEASESPCRSHHHWAGNQRHQAVDEAVETGSSNMAPSVIVLRRRPGWARAVSGDQ